MTRGIACPSCGHPCAMVRFEDQAVPLTAGGDGVEVSALSGHCCESCGEVCFDAQSAWRYSEASDKLVLKQRKERSEGQR